MVGSFLFLKFVASALAGQGIEENVPKLKILQVLLAQNSTKTLVKYIQSEEVAFHLAQAIRHLYMRNVISNTSLADLNGNPLLLPLLLSRLTIK